MEPTELIDLASSRVGGKALAANDEFFASKENLLKSQAPVFIPDKYTSRGKWMDGWETRRRRVPGHDWCLVRLGLRGVVRGVEVDTSHFLGNYPEFCSIEACDQHEGVSPKRLLHDPALWTEILPRAPLQGGAPNKFPIRSLRPWTHLRLHIYPDGGVARLRAYGDVIPDWAKLQASRKAVDLAAVAHGAVVLDSSDRFFGHPINMLMPGRAKNMGDGWETKRRRGPGHDWALLKLGASGALEAVEIDTNHFKGNYPDSFLLEGCLAPGASAGVLLSAETSWRPVLPRLKLGPHRRHLFRRELKDPGPFSHLRLSIYPDGGVSRLRVYGRPQAT